MLHKNIYDKLPQRCQKFYNEWLSDKDLETYVPISMFICSQTIDNMIDTVNNLDGVLEYYVEHDLATSEEYSESCKEYRHKFHELKKLLQTYHDLRRLQ